MKFLSDAILGEKPYDGDYFKNRKDYGGSLKKFINNVEDGCVIAIDADWGEGKTTFVKWWYEDLKTDHCPIYFDAYKYDFNSDPFSAIMKVLYSHFPEQQGLKQSVTNAIKKLSTELFPAIMSLGAIAGATFAFGPAGTVAGAIASEGVAKAGEVINNVLTKEDNKALEQLIDDFKQNLDIVTTALYLDNKKRLVFIIDELDRCRPTFAVEIIEKIKHFFSVAGIVWVLVMNKKQLETSIKHVYGTDDANRYLSKFINVSSTLPKTVQPVNTRFASDHYTDLVNGLLNHTCSKGTTKEQLRQILTPLLRIANLSIREAQKVLFHMQLLIEEQTDGHADWYLVLGLLLSFAKVHNPDLYNSLKNKNTAHNSIEQLGIIKQCEELDRPLKWIAFYIQFALTNNIAEARKIAYEGHGSEALADIEGSEFRDFCRVESQYIEIAHSQIETFSKKLDLFEFE